MHFIQTFDEAENGARDTFNSGYEMGREHEAAVEPELDELLNSIHPKCFIKEARDYLYSGIFDKKPVTKWRIDIRWPDLEDPSLLGATGTGSTRMEAIRDAVRRAREASNDRLL